MKFRLAKKKRKDKELKCYIDEDLLGSIFSILVASVRYIVRSKCYPYPHQVVFVITGNTLYCGQSHSWTSLPVRESTESSSFHIPFHIQFYKVNYLIKHISFKSGYSCCFHHLPWTFFSVLSFCPLTISSLMSWFCMWSIHVAM
jgi:hypothetical protein